MATQESKVIVKLEAEIGKLTKELTRANKSISNFEKKTETAAKKTQKSLSSLSTGFKFAAGIAGFAALTRAVVNASAKQQAAVAQLQQGYETTGGAVGQSVEEMIKKAGELQKVSIFGDEQFIDAQAKLVTFTNITKDEFNKTIELAADLSVRMGQDLKSSVVQLGKALNDPVKGLSALSRVGVSFSESQKTVIKQLTETGDLVGAQKLILQELEKEFGGSARAARDTLGGALQALNNAFGDLLENKGGLKQTTKALNEFTDILSDPETQKSAEALTSGLIQGLGATVKLLNEAIKGVRGLAERFAAMTTGVSGDDIEGLKRERDKIWKALANPTERLVFFGTGGIVKYYNEAELKAKLDEIYRAIDRYEESHKSKKNEIIGFDASAITKGLTAGASNAPAIQAPQLDPINKKYEEFLKNLQLERKYYGEASRVARAKFKIESGGLDEINEKQRQRILTEAAALDKLEQDKKLTEDIKALKLQALSDEERALLELQANYKLLNEGIKAGAIEASEAAKVGAQIATQYEENKKKSEEQLTGMNEFAAEAARGMQGAFADFLFDPFDGGLKKMGDNFAKLIQRMIAEAAAAQILNGLFGADFTKTGQLGGFLGGLFADGGIMPPNRASIVGERGPEIVIPNTPTMVLPNNVLNSLANSSAPNVNFNASFNISGEADQSMIKRTANQVLREFKRGMAGV